MSKAAPGQAPIEFGIFGYIHDSRQTYGLRAQDYLRYRRFCANRLRNVRSAAKMAQGTSTTFRKKEVSADMVSRPEHLEILLLQAERAWAFAMDLRELYSRTEEPRHRYHLIRRLRAACKAGEQLAVVAASGACDGRTSLEAQAYRLQIQSQLHFELEEWASALDCAVLSRVISEQLALAGSSRHYALAHSMIEALDPIVRLAAYRVRMTGAQQSLPAELASQWHSTKMLNDAARVEQAIPGYGGITAALDELVTGANSSANSDAQALAYDNSLKWRGGAISFASQELAALIESAQGALKNASESGDDDGALDAAATAFNGVKRAARRCHSESIAASAKIHSTASEALESAYLAVQLYSTCALHSIAIAKYVGQAQVVAAKLGIAIGTTDGPSSIGHGGSWILDSEASSGRRGSASKRGSQKGNLTDSLAEATRVVVLHDLIRKCLSNLKAAVADVLGNMAPATSRTVHGHQLIEEVTAAEAYYDCLRGYYAAALHASPAHKRHLDSLALLDSTLSESIPRALALATAASKHAVAHSDGLVVDELWRRVVAVTSSDIHSVEQGIKCAVPVVSRLCAASVSADPAAAQRKSGARDWESDPTGRPAMVANELAGAASKSQADGPSQQVPKLVDLAAIEFAAVPIKPLFYDLAAANIDFDLDAIGQRSGKSAAAGGSSKLGSIIGSLWGSR